MVRAIGSPELAHDEVLKAAAVCEKLPVAAGSAIILQSPATPTEFLDTAELSDEVRCMH